MKNYQKSLLTVCVLSALSAPSLAAQTTIYGRIDAGLRFTNTSADVSGVDDINKFEMASGNFTGSRFGFKGSEDLGNGMTVSFILENGFSNDNGQLRSTGKIFDRQATLHLSGDFGEVAFGRAFILAHDAPTTGIGGHFNPFGSGFGDVGGQTAIWGGAMSTQADNMITYWSPNMSGFKLTAQYSFGGADGGEENRGNTDRYWGIGGVYTNGSWDLAFVVDGTRLDNTKHSEDTTRVIVGGSYDFGFIRPYLSVSYFSNGSISDICSVYNSAGAEYTKYLNNYYNGVAGILAASAPILGGTANAMIGYLDADYQGAAGLNGNITDPQSESDLKRLMIGLGYVYRFSKTTLVYADAGYWRDDVKRTVGKDFNPSVFQGAIGIAHYF